MVQASAIDQLAAGFRGRLIEPSDPRYDRARALYNGMIDKRPRLIAQCSNVADVVSAVRFGREQRLLVAVRGGGHNGPGLGSCDDGLVIDLSMMKSVRVDPESRTVRAEPGCTQGDVDHATHAFGLAVPAGIVSTTGIAGLTLGGGHGYLTRQHGLTIDNLLEADVVLADGRFVTASASQHEDLFWALRGGGGNFGIVTSFVYRAHPVRDVYAGPVFWTLEDAPRVMAWYRAFLPAAAPELGAFLGLKTVPSSDPFPREIWGQRICALISCYNGPREDAERLLRSMRTELPTPILDGMTTMPFPALQGLFDPLLPSGLQWYWKGHFVKSLSDDAIETHVQHAKSSPSELSLMHLYPIDGAVHRVAPDETAWSTRDATWSMVIAGIDADPAKAEALRRWGRDYSEAMRPFSMGGAYVNFMMEEGAERVATTYGANYERLRRIKARYDPDNFFRVNQNVVPAAGSR
jgi:FAD/FMN-containing dehydrogenase